jgi:hypothetical protein
VENQSGFGEETEMNVSKAVELAFAEAIRDNAEMGEGVTVRAWQSLESDGSWKKYPDRAFPMVDVRCSPPRTSEMQGGREVECAILIGTKTDDDKSHAFVSQMYDEIQKVCDDLFADFRRADETSEPLKTWLATVEDNVESGGFGFGGFTFGEGLSPMDDGGVNMIGITMVVHYSKTGF